MPICAYCGKEITEGEEVRLTEGGESLPFCGLKCLYSSEPLKELRSHSIIDMVLNKTLFEVLAIVTGLGGVYFTLFESASNALLADTVSVVFALAAMIIGVEHIRYVEEHGGMRKAVLFTGVVVISVLVVLVWIHGFRAAG